MTQLDNERPTPSRKIITYSVLFFVLVVLPAGSWYYLRGGLNWRKEAIGQLGNYGKIRGAYVVYPDGEKLDQLKSNLVVLHYFGENPELTDANKHIMDTGQKLFEQFGQNHHFRMCMIAERGTSDFRSYAQTLPSSDYAAWVWTGGLGSWRTILQNGYESFTLKEGVKAAPEYYALADTSGIIRRFYDAMDEKQVGRMVEQIAILLPKED